MSKKESNPPPAVPNMLRPPPPPALRIPGVSATTLLWIVGQLKGKWRHSGSVWELQGVFDSEKKAVKASRTRNYFVIPMILNKSCPHKSVNSTKGFYPLMKG